MLKMIKINLSQSFASFKAKGNKNFYYFLVIFVILAVVMGWQYYNLAGPMADKKMIFFSAGLGMFFFLLFLLVLQSQNYFFHNKDYQLLASMPIKTWKIILSKSIASILLCYIYQLLFLLPTLVVYFILAPFNFTILIGFVFSFLLFPLIPLSISFLIHLVINLILTKAKYKTAINYLLMIIMFVGFFCSFALFNDILNNFTVFKLIFPSVYNFYMGTTGKLLYVLYFLLISTALFAFALYMVSLGYNKINQAPQSVNYSKMKEIKAKRVSYFKFELKRYFSIPIYVFNTIIGPILLIAVPFLSFINSYSFSSFDFILIIVFLLGLTNTTSASISIEGSKINLLKSLPIKLKRLFLNKILLNVILTLPSLIFADIMILSLNKFLWYEILEIIFIPLLSIVTFSIFGLLVNLYVPKLRYNNYTEVVKQSMSVFITNLSIVVLNILIYTLLPLAKLMPWANALIYFALILTSFIVIVGILLKKGASLFYKLSV